MASADKTMLVRIAANLDALRKGLAEGKLGIEQTTAAMTKLASSLDGSKLEQRALNIVGAINQVGGAAKLTDAEARRMLTTLDAWADKGTRMGTTLEPAFQATRNQLRQVVDAADKGAKSTEGWITQAKGLAGALGIAFSVQSVVSFGRELLQLGDDLVRVADRTGLTTEEVQRLQFIAEQSGNDVEQFTSAIGRMQKRLVEGDDSAVAGLRAMGISLDDIRKLGPYEQMAAIAAGIEKIPNPANQAQAAMAIFGKEGTTILPTLKAHFRELGNEAPVMADKTARALDTAGDSLNKFKRTAQVWAAEAYNYLGRVFDMGLIAIYRYIAGFYESIAKIEGWLAKIPGASKVFPNLADDIRGATTSAQWFRDAAASMATQLNTTAPAIRKVVPPIVEVETASKKAAKAQKELGEAMDPQIANLMAIANKHLASEIQSVEAAERSMFAQIGKDWANFPVAPWQDPTWATRTTLASRNLTSIAFAPSGASPGLPSAPGFFASVFGDPKQFGQQLSGALMAAIQGGGNLFDAAGGLVGQKLGTKAASMFSGHFLKEGSSGLFSKALGGVFDSVLPIVGSLLGPLVGKIWDGIKGLFDRNKGRDLAVEFANSMGGFDALQQKLLALGPEYDRLWRGLTQLTNNNSREEAQRAIDAITEALARHEKQVASDAAAQEAAMQQVAAAQQEAIDQAKGKVAELDQQIASLNQSIANEAPEEEMGVIERNTRAQIASLQAQRDEATKTLESLMDTAAGSMADVATAIKELPNEIAIKLAVELQTRIGGTGGAIPMAEGGDFLVTKPTLFLAGEGGRRERATFTPEGAVGAGRGRMLQPIQIQLGPRTLWEGLIETAHAEGLA